MHKNCNLLVMRENSEDALWMPMWQWINNGSLLQEQCRAARRHCFEFAAPPFNGFRRKSSLSLRRECEAALNAPWNISIIFQQRHHFQGTRDNLGRFPPIILHPLGITLAELSLNGCSVVASPCKVRALLAAAELRLHLASGYSAGRTFSKRFKVSSRVALAMVTASETMQGSLFVST